MSEKLNNSNTGYSIINNDTGEIETTTPNRITIHSENDRQKKKQYLKEIDSEFQKQSKNKVFTRMYDDALQKLQQRLSVKSLGIVMILMNYISCKDCILRSGHKKGTKILTRKDISEITGIGINNITRELKPLLDNNIIAKIKCNDIYGYVFNPYICNKGGVTKAVTGLFNDWYP